MHHSAPRRTDILKAIGWARKYGLRVNLDFHALPGSQNGYNHSGKQGSINILSGAMGLANAQRVLDYIRTVTEFISQPAYRNVVPMFSVMNEPYAATIGVDPLRSLCVPLPSWPCRAPTLRASCADSPQLSQQLRPDLRPDARDRRHGQGQRALDHVPRRLHQLWQHVGRRVRGPLERVGPRLARLAQVPVLRHAERVEPGLPGVAGASCSRSLSLLGLLRGRASC